MTGAVQNGDALCVEKGCVGVSLSPRERVRGRERERARARAQYLYEPAAKKRRD